MAALASALADAVAADVAALCERFGEAVPATKTLLGQPTAIVERGAIADVARFLRDERGYQLLRSLTAVDYLPSEPRFHVVYHLVAIPPNALAGDPKPRPESPARCLRLKVPLPGGDPVIPSLVAVYSGANWPEREVWDMFGIVFTSHPDLHRILLPENWQGHPLRKDAPLAYEPVQFSFNFDEIQNQKPQARR